MPPRTMIRLVRGTYRRKAFGTPEHPVYPPDAIVAFYAMIELAEEQPNRGRFESLALLRVLLEGPDGRGHRFARQVPFLIAQHDLVQLPDGAWYVDGWDELQEGDLTVAERVTRHRNRHANGHANGPANGDVTPGAVSTPRPRATRADAQSGAIADLDGGLKTVDGRQSANALSSRAREGLVHVTDELATVVEGLTGRGVLALGASAQTCLDDLAERHGADTLIVALNRVAKGIPRPSGPQLVFGARNLLDPIKGRGELEEDEQAERRAARESRRRPVAPQVRWRPEA